MGKVGRTLVFVAVPVVVVFSLFNFYLLNHFNKSSSATTFLLNERIYNKHSDSSSEKEVHNAGQDVLNARNVGHGNNKAADWELGEGKVNERDLEKSEKDGEHSPNEKNVDRFGKSVSLKDPIIDKLIDKLKQASLRTFFPSYFWNMTMYNLTRKLGGPARMHARTLAGYKNIQTTGPLQAWKLLPRNIRQFSLYDPEDPNLETALREMATLPFVEADENDGGTQLKVNVRMSNDGRAVLKPMKYGREVEADENRYIFDDMERHVAEIAAFQLDNVLGFYRVPPTIGRWVNISLELKPIVPKTIHKTFFISPVVLWISVSTGFAGDARACATIITELLEHDSCPVNGNWTSWSNWQACSTTSGPGLAKRTRTCSNPKPSLLGRDCSGDSNEYKLCLNDCPCPINGFWSQWSVWLCYIFRGKRILERSVFFIVTEIVLFSIICHYLI